jgi:hypothetical protein
VPLGLVLALLMVTCPVCLGSAVGGRRELLAMRAYRAVRGGSVNEFDVRVHAIRRRAGRRLCVPRISSAALTCRVAFSFVRP